MSSALLSTLTRRITARAAPSVWGRISAPAAQWGDGEDECCGGGSCNAATTRALSTMSAMAAAWDEDECCGGGTCDGATSKVDLTASMATQLWGNEEDECCGGGTCDGATSKVDLTASMATQLWGNEEDECCGGGTCGAAVHGAELFANVGLAAASHFTILAAAPSAVTAAEAWEGGEECCGGGSCTNSKLALAAAGPEDDECACDGSCL